jgi:hypothetical protein
VMVQTEQPVISCVGVSWHFLKATAIGRQCWGRTQPGG